MEYLVRTEFVSDVIRERCEGSEKVVVPQTGARTIQRYGNDRFTWHGDIKHESALTGQRAPQSSIVAAQLSGDKTSFHSTKFKVLP